MPINYFRKSRKITFAQCSDTSLTEKTRKVRQTKSTQALSREDAVRHGGRYPHRSKLLLVMQDKSCGGIQAPVLVCQIAQVFSLGLGVYLSEAVTWLGYVQGQEDFSEKNELNAQMSVQSQETRPNCEGSQRINALLKTIKTSPTFFYPHPECYIGRPKQNLMWRGLWWRLVGLCTHLALPSRDHYHTVIGKKLVKN